MNRRLSSFAQAVGGTTLMTLLLSGAAPLPEQTPEKSDGCNGDVRQRAAPGPLGYSDRHDGGDPRCEGLYQRDVASDNLPEISPIALVLRARTFTPSDKTVISLAWPHVRAPIDLCARHTVDGILYRMDAAKQVGDTPERPDAACDEFRWHTGVLEQISKQYTGFDLANLRVLASVSIPLDGEVAESFPEVMRGRSLLLPLVVNAPPASDQPAALTPPPQTSEAARLALAIHTNRELRDVTLRCMPITDATGGSGVAPEPIVKTIATAPRGVFVIRNLDLPIHGTEFWSAELSFSFLRDSQWESDRALFYIMKPSIETARWAQHAP